MAKLAHSFCPLSPSLPLSLCLPQLPAPFLSFLFRSVWFSSTSARQAGLRHGKTWLDDEPAIAGPWPCRSDRRLAMERSRPPNWNLLSRSLATGAHSPITNYGDDSEAAS
ncbi:hypothetical protein V2G26_016501 [Clonostachys chloroleuca]